MPSSSKPPKQTKVVQVDTDRSGYSDTPPNSPAGQFLDPLEFAREVINAVQLITSQETKAVTLSEPGSTPSASKPVDRASRFEVKQVHEVWNSEAHAYKISESPPTIESTELDAYVFVIRTRVGRTDSRSTVYVDIKSPSLRDILRVVLKDIEWISLSDEKPAVEQNLLFHYLPELEGYRKHAADSTPSGQQGLRALELLIRTVKSSYKSTFERLRPLLEEGKITYDLLWALFKASMHVISICSGSGKSRCLRYNMGEEKKTGQGVEYFELQCQYLDFDGKVFGMVTEKLAIEKFRGAKTITTLDTFPIRFHSTPDEITQFLTARGQKFIDLMGTHHQFYDGHTFYQRKEGLVRISVRSKIMIDAERFRKMHPNYPRLLVKKSDMFMSSVSEQRVRSHGLDPANLGDSELMICSPTVMGFSLNDKFWGEYAVEDIKPIEWSSTLLDRLSLPAQKKNAIKAITQSRLSRADVEKQPNRSPKGFDDVVAGKGRGINILLHGPPGVGKTFTAEALSEYYQRPLYSASAGELSADAGELELQLTRIFDIASAWNAILLLDEADVFFQRRSELTLERNRLVAVFLRKLEYFHGILFLTTNLIDHFDNALLDRIHLVMKYDDLDRTARNEVVTGFLERMPGGHRSSDISKDYLDRFACMKLNGRQIKNALAVADTLAAEQQEHLSCSHISQALALNNVVVPESSDTSFDLYD